MFEGVASDCTSAPLKVTRYLEPTHILLQRYSSMQVLNGLPQHVKVVDLSADFRLRSTDMYAEWYGGEHKAPKLQEEAVYGLTEHYREAVSGARLVANPGCYPTSCLLPLLPLMKAGAIIKEGITIDSKSGTSGAGRAAKEAFLFCEVADGMHAYGVGKHRHMPEIEQELAVAAGSDVTISFTPHLIPMSRGMQSTIYVTMAEGATVDSLRETIADFYKDEYFVRCVQQRVLMMHFLLPCGCFRVDDTSVMHAVHVVVAQWS